MDKEALTVTEAAYLIGYSAATIYKLIHQEKIPYTFRGKAYSIPKKHLLDYYYSSLRKAD